VYVYGSLGFPLGRFPAMNPNLANFLGREIDRDVIRLRIFLVVDVTEMPAQWRNTYQAYHERS
jgi:hypothetical protein